MITDRYGREVGRHRDWRDMPREGYAISVPERPADHVVGLCDDERDEGRYERAVFEPCSVR